MGGAEEMEEVNGAGAPSNGDANGSAPEGAAQPDPLEAGQPAARKRSRWAAGEEGAAEGAAEGVAEVVEEAPKKRKSKWGSAQAPDVIDVASTLDPSRVSKEAMAKAQRMAAIQAKIASQMQSLGSVPGMASSSMVSVPGAVSAFGGAGFHSEGNGNSGISCPKFPS
ncbi:hypothetical protein T484DRAFT_1794638 [Baffinella frigidus]|nr:hypothetical protein T484DRAFT_1794638 [Cryptophyta sp. CCMP2293]